MRGWGSSSVLALVGVLLLWVGVAQFEGAYVPETATVSGKIVRVVPVDGRTAIVFAEHGPLFVLPSSTLPQPTIQALADATNVSVVYDTRSYGRATHAIVELGVDGHSYFSSATYQAFAALLALIVLVPGALMFGLGAAALSRLSRGERDVETDEDAVGATVSHQALVIPFPRRTAPVELT